MKRRGIVLDTHVGTWAVMGETIWRGKKVFLLEHETYGDDAACVIIDRLGRIVHDDVWNGFEDLEDME